MARNLISRRIDGVKDRMVHAQDIIDRVVSSICRRAFYGFKLARIRRKSLRFDKETVEQMSHEGLLVSNRLW
jgi:hypothetical protein